MKKLINLLLLTVMFFSIAHGVVFKNDSVNHCSVQEYLSEFDHAMDEHHNDHKYNCCEIHFMFHLSFLLPDNISFFEHIVLNSTIEYSLHLNDTLLPHNIFRPPVSNI